MLSDEASSLGALKVRVYTANEAIPIENAAVHIRKYTNGEQGASDLLFSLRTDADGITEAVSLPAPSIENSLSPNEGAIPYSLYIVTVKKSGYNSVESIGVPVFPEITSIQSVNLTPLTERQILNGLGGETIFFENDGYPSLNGSATENNSEVAK